MTSFSRPKLTQTLRFNAHFMGNIGLEIEHNIHLFSPQNMPDISSFSERELTKR